MVAHRGESLTPRHKGRWVGTEHEMNFRHEESRGKRPFHAIVGLLLGGESVSKTCNLFSEEQENIISDVLALTSGVDPKKLSTGDDHVKDNFYKYLESTPYASLVVEISDALKESGFELVKLRQPGERSVSCNVALGIY